MPTTYFLNGYQDAMQNGLARNAQALHLYQLEQERKHQDQQLALENQRIGMAQTEQNRREQDDQVGGQAIAGYYNSQQPQTLPDGEMGPPAPAQPFQMPGNVPLGAAQHIAAAEAARHYHEAALAEQGIRLDETKRHNMEMEKKGRAGGGLSFATPQDAAAHLDSILTTFGTDLKVTPEERAQAAVELYTTGKLTPITQRSLFGLSATDKFGMEDHARTLHEQFQSADHEASYWRTQAGKADNPMSMLPPSIVAQVKAKAAETQTARDQLLRSLLESTPAGPVNNARSDTIAPQKAPTATGPVNIHSDVEYNTLPSGTQFVGPDGKARVKP